MSKLLNKPFKAFSIYALIILVCSVPVYYLVVDYIWIGELDEHNEMIKKRLTNKLNELKPDATELQDVLGSWNMIQPGTQLSPLHSTKPFQDNTYTIIKVNQASADGEIDRFRVLRSFILVAEQPYLLSVETNVEETDETMTAIAVVTFIFFVLLVAGFIILNKRIARNIWNPFNQTLAKIKVFDLNNKQELLLESSDIEEFEQLNKVLRNLTKQNIAAFKQQIVFIENAAHELQTPLAVMKSKIDLLQQLPQLSDEQYQMLAALTKPMSRMTRISKNLLVLAKLENNQFSELENSSLGLVLDEIIELLADFVETKKISLFVEKQQEITLSCSKILLEMLLNNLLINAIIHSVEGSSINISMLQKELIIRNTGLGALNKNKLFKRFSNSATNVASSGLGLAIAKEICNKYNWKLSYKYELNRHIFSVEF